jgi:CTP:molybdopterin cytidylyltransferase MocA
MMRLFALLPAGGTSSRMGCPKLALPLGKLTVLEHVVAAVQAAGVRDILVVLGPQVAHLKPVAEKAGAWTLLLSRQTPDMRASVECGLDWLEQNHHPERSDAFLLLPADHPTLTKEVMETLIKARAESPATIGIPTFEGRRGHPALIGWEHVTGMRAWPRNQGLNAYLRAQASLTLEVPCASEDVLRDLDTPEDYEKLQQGFTE